jgi:hypothetical protein
MMDLKSISLSAALQSRTSACLSSNQYPNMSIDDLAFPVVACKCDDPGHVSKARKLCREEMHLILTLTYLLGHVLNPSSHSQTAFRLQIDTLYTILGLSLSLSAQLQHKKVSVHKYEIPLRDVFARLGQSPPTPTTFHFHPLNALSIQSYQHPRPILEFSTFSTPLKFTSTSSVLTTQPKFPS